MAKFKFDKLVRDNTLDILKSDNVETIYHTLSDKDYSAELLRKLVEEAQEVQESQSLEELTEEIADVHEVLSALMQVNNISQEAVNAKRQQKNEKRGAFAKRIYIDSVEADENNKWAQYYSKTPEKYKRIG